MEDESRLSNPIQGSREMKLHWFLQFKNLKRRLAIQPLQVLPLFIVVNCKNAVAGIDEEKKFEVNPAMKDMYATEKQDLLSRILQVHCGDIIELQIPRSHSKSDWKPPASNYCEPLNLL